MNTPLFCSWCALENGGVQEYCWKFAVCGTVSPLSCEKSTGSMGLCGQDSC